MALDRLRFQHLQRVFRGHRQRVENAESHYDAPRPRFGPGLALTLGAIAYNGRGFGLDFHLKTKQMRVVVF